MKKLWAAIIGVLCVVLFAGQALATPIVIWVYRNGSASTISSAAADLITEDVPGDWLDNVPLPNGSAIIATAFCDATNGTYTKTFVKRAGFKVVSGVLTILGQELIGTAYGDLAFVAGYVSFAVTGVDQTFIVQGGGLSGNVDWDCHVDYSILGR